MVIWQTKASAQDGQSVVGMVLAETAEAAARVAAGPGTGALVPTVPGVWVTGDGEIVVSATMAPDASARYNFTAGRG